MCRLVVICHKWIPLFSKLWCIQYHCMISNAVIGGRSGIAWVNSEVNYACSDYLMWRIVYIVLTHGTSVLVVDAHCAHTTPTPTDLPAYQIRGKSTKYNTSVCTARSVRSHVGWRALQCSSSLSLVWQWGNDKFISYTSCFLIYFTFPCFNTVNCVSIGSDNGSSPGRRQATIWTNADILSIWHERIYFNEIIFEIQIFSF